MLDALSLLFGLALLLLFSHWAVVSGVWLSHLPPFMQPGDLNIFTQVALVVLVGLAAVYAVTPVRRETGLVTLAVSVRRPSETV
jgi:multidrug efflux pump